MRSTETFTCSRDKNDCQRSMGAEGQRSRGAWEQFLQMTNDKSRGKPPTLFFICHRSFVIGHFEFGAGLEEALMLNSWRRQ